jgi:anti-anti-sigma factor
MELLELRRGPASVTLALKGRLDALTAVDFDKLIREHLKELNRAQIDCSELDYISSAGLRVMLSTAKRLKEQGGELRLAALKETVATVFKISGFDKIIPIAATLDDEF